MQVTIYKSLIYEMGILLPVLVGYTSHSGRSRTRSFHFFPEDKALLFSFNVFKRKREN